MEHMATKPTADLSNEHHSIRQMTLILDGASKKLLAGADKIEESNLILGSCSSGGTCVYNSGVKNIDLKVTLHKTGEDKTSDKILEQKI